MFNIGVPLSFKIGDTLAVTVNKSLATLFWRAADILVLNGRDARKILLEFEDGDLHYFTCADADGTPKSVTVHQEKSGEIFIIAVD